jgi:hypothetical protein
LTAEDKEFVLKSEKMKTFISGVIKVADVAIWIAASCLECMVS